MIRPRVTVLVTLYNKRPYVEEAVRSVLAQTFTEFELLVVDDASTDGGLDLVRKFADPRIRILESERNTGRPAAANRGYAAARGEYLAILDGDDLMYPERLGAQVSFMDRHPEVAVVGSWVLYKGSRERLWKPPATDKEIRGHLLWGSQVLYGACMIRRKVLVDHSITCNESWRLPGMDYFLLLELGKYGAYANLEQPLTVYRIGEQNMRHGRDPVADRKARLLETFRLLDLGLGEEDAALMVMWERGGGLQPTPRNLWRCRQLHARLLRINKERALFPGKAFQQDLERHWRELFHAVHPHSLWSIWTYLFLAPRLADRGQLRIALRATLARLTGR